MGDTIPASDHRLSRREVAALLVLLAAVVASLLIPVVRQPQDYHAFADQRALLGLPNAADVLSNLAFVAVGVLSMWRLRLPIPWLAPVLRMSMVALFAGLTLAGFGSAYYHLHPTDSSLVWDRLPMTVAFAGVCGAIAAQRISYRFGLAILVVMLLVGPASVVYWAVTGDLSLYLVVQFGLIAGVFLLLVFAPNPADRFAWWALLVWYVAAKLAETADAQVWIATNELFAGHMIKHVAAALGGLAIANSLRPGRASAARRSSQSPPSRANTPGAAPSSRARPRRCGP